MIEGTINIFDIFGSIVLIGVLIILANFYKNSKIIKYPEYKYFTWGLITKIIGAIALAFVYVFYYGGGDTIEYFKGGSVLSDLFFNKPLDYLKILFTDSNELSVNFNYIKNLIWLSRSSEEWFFIKIVSVFNIFSFNSYLISNIYLSIFAFIGSWKMYKAFNAFFPKSIKISFIAIFLLPSVIFWGSGMLKDTISLSALGIFFYYFTKIFYKNNFSTLSIIILIISALIIFKLKAYIIIGFLPGLFFALYIMYKNRIKNNVLRKLIAPIFLILVTIIGGYTLISVMAQSNKYKVDGLEKRLEGFHSWHTVQGGSTYNLGKIEYTPIGIIKKVPEAVNVTFFRPYLWEVHSAVTFIGSIESLSFFLLFIFTLWKLKLKWFTKIFSNEFLTMAFVYTIFFGFAVGFTSYNFGALARYKIPVLPFFAFIILYLYSEIKKKQAN